MKNWRSCGVAVAIAAMVVATAWGAGAQQASPQQALPAAVAAPTAAAPATTDPNAAVGSDLAGNACRWEGRNDVPGERGAPPPANIFCGTAKRPTGSVMATAMPLGMPADPAGRQRLMERAAAETPIGRDDSDRMTCGAGQWQQTKDGTPLMLSACTLNDSEWPQVVAVAPLGPYLVRAAGLPSALPALERAMARIAGLDQAKAAGFADPAAARARLAKMMGDRAIRATAGNFDEYSDLTETARVEASRKNYAASEGHYRSALTILTNVFGAQSPGVGLLLMELALQISNQERFDEAAALIRRADPIIQTNGTAADRARLLLYQAFDAANRGRFDEALEYANNSASTWRGVLSQSGVEGGQLNTEAAQAGERGELAFSLDLAAEMALRTGDTAAADAAASEAGEIITTTPGLPPWWRAEVLTTIGEIRAAQGRLNDADNAFRAALILQERLFGNTAPTAVTYLVIARVFAEEKLYDESVRAFRLALGILRSDEVARSEVVVDQIAPFIVSANAVADAHPDQRAQLNAEVFEATQLIGKSLVDDTVNRVASRLAEAAPAIAGLVNDLEQTRRARDAARLTLAQEVSLPDDQRGSIRENQLMNEINAQTAKAEQLQKQIETKFPDYAKFANPGPVKLAEAQQALRPEEALVLVEAGREHSYVLVVRKDKMQARAIALDEAAIGDAVGNLRKAFVVREGAVEPFDTPKAYALYHSLFGGVEPTLAGAKLIVFVPTGALSSLPLGLLVTKPVPAAAARDYVNAQWLLRTAAVSEAPSARAFISQREQGAAAQATRPLFAVGNPDFAGGQRAAAKNNGLEALANECRDEGPMPSALIRALPPLPDTADEVRKVAAIVHADNGSVLLGDEATEARVRASGLGQYHILYFATHGLLPTALRCQSEPALVLTPPAVTTSRENDGVLDASEVAQLQLNADLVVLSACNTATAAGQFGGDSLSGLAGAFFHAGARSVLASNWEVPSAQTVRLMTTLFTNLGPNLSGGVAEALRQAQLSLANQPATSHPFFWAAFTLIGDGGPATTARRNASAVRPTTALASAGDAILSSSEKQQ